MTGPPYVFDVTLCATITYKPCSRWLTIKAFHASGTHGRHLVSIQLRFIRKQNERLIVKTLVIWVGALVFGFFGGVIGQRLSNGSSASTGLASTTKAHAYELVDRSGLTVSIWTVDTWGRPYLGMSDAKWEGRIVIGPIEGSDVVSNEPPEWDAWGIEVTAPGRTAHAVLGTSTPLDTKKPTAFISLQSGQQTWLRDAAHASGDLTVDKSPLHK